MDDVPDIPEEDVVTGMGDSIDVDVDAADDDEEQPSEEEQLGLFSEGQEEVISISHDLLGRLIS
jgi:hypothetical protein